MLKIYQSGENFAQAMDANDPLSEFHSRFHHPLKNGKPSIYFCGNSLGLQPVNVVDAFKTELESWQQLGVEGYFKGKNPWLTFQHQLSPALSRIMGCQENEVSVMNALTVNLHLLMLSFYKPTSTRYKILMEAGAFPSDQYAIETQVRFHGLHPEQAIIEVAPRPGEKCLREEDILEAIYKHRDTLAVVMFSGIQYYTGQLFPIAEITRAAQEVGAIAGFDLAHVAGNVPIQLHQWNVDFAVWCSYKYLNAGPGAAGGIFIHEKHATQTEKIRLGGWWGNDEKTRFLMQKGFLPKPEASGWNLSTNQVFNMIGLKASLEYFEEAGIQNLHEKSIVLTGYLEYLLNQTPDLAFEIITPKKVEQRGAQLSLYFPEKGKEIRQRMEDSGIITDYREPGVIRVAPSPFYNTFRDVYNFCEILKEFV